MSLSSITDPAAKNLPVNTFYANSLTLTNLTVTGSAIIPPITPVVNFYIPTLAFGGSSVGITGSLIGYYEVIGKIVFFNITVSLNNKGTNGGSATITLPPGASLIPNNTTSASFNNDGNITGSSNSYLRLFIIGSNNVAQVFNTNVVTGISTGLDYTSFSNTSAFSCSGFYFIN